MTAAESRSDPRQPRRLLKKRNTEGCYPVADDPAPGLSRLATGNAVRMATGLVGAPEPPSGTVAAHTRALEPADVEAARRLVVGGRAGDLDRLAQLAARLLRTPAAQVSLLTDVQTVLGSAGQPDGTTGSRGPLGDSLCTVTARGGGPLVVADAAADARVNALPPVTSGAVGSYLGVPLVSTDGSRVGALCVFDPQPRAWTSADVELLSEVAVSTMAELELGALGHDLEADRARWALAIDAAGIGTFDWDLVSGRLAWDERLIELFGYELEGFGESIEAFNARLHPDDLPRVTRLLQEAIDTCGEYAAEYRVVLPDGRTRWIAARGRALCGDDGRAFRVIGAAYDTTAVREGEARVARVLESMPTAFFSLDRAWRFSYVNAEAERVLGRDRDDLLGGDLWELFPFAVGSEFETRYREAAATGRPTSFEAYYPAPLEAWYEVRAWPGPDGLSVYFHDVSRRRTAQESAVAAARRTELLASVSQELAATLDVEEAVARLAQAVVPGLGDWCIVSLLEGGADGSRHLRDVGWWHADEGVRETVAGYSAARLAATTDHALLEQALASVRPVVVDRDAADAIAARQAPGQARDLLRDLDPQHVIIAAIHARGTPLGLLTVYAAAPPTDAQWVAEAVQEVGARAGLALENARLYAQQRHLAEELQRSLLTDPPDQGDLEVRVAYQAAQAVASVGGDWYDAFPQPDGATVLVIGDVVGHDTQAAAEMGQVRGLLRGIAVTSGEGPARVLTRLDDALRLLRVDTTATAVVARLEQSPADRGRGVTRLRWSNAGHPPPILLADGEVRVLADERDPDLLLGIDPTTERFERVVEVPRGSTVLLYTDGLVERRGESIDEGVQRLVAVLEQLAPEERPLPQLLEALLARMAEDYDDDVALAAVRLHPQEGLL